MTENSEKICEMKKNSSFITSCENILRNFNTKILPKYIDWYEESVNLELFNSDPLSDLSRAYTPTSQEFLNQLIDDNAELTNDFNEQFTSILSSIPITLDENFLLNEDDLPSTVLMDTEDDILSEQIIDSLLIGDLKAAQNSINQHQEELKPTKAK